MPFALQIIVKCVRIVIAGTAVFNVSHSVRDYVIRDVEHVNVTDPLTDRVLGAFYCTHSWDPHLKNIVAGFAS